jgi:hypothetical protein
MALIARNSGGGSYEPVPVGVVQAVCCIVCDIGTQEGSYQGKPVSHHQCIIAWEIDAIMSQGEYEGKRFMVSKFYTLSLHEKATLRKDLESWRGKAFTDEELDGFDVEKLIGANCMLNIVEYKKLDGSVGQKISAIMPMIKSMNKMQPITTTTPQWMIDKRNESIEAREGSNQPRQPGDEQEAPQEDLPF